MQPLSSATESPTSSVGESFAGAIARRDFSTLAELLHSEVDFRALTPRRAWQAATREEALGILRTWFGACQDLEIVGVETAEIAGRGHVSYRFVGERSEGPFLIEQQAYYDEAAGQIAWIRILCSGFRPR